MIPTFDKKKFLYLDLKYKLSYTWGVMVVDLSIIISNFNTKILLEHTLHSLKKATKNIVCEIIVVDDASNDGSWEMVKEKFPKVILIQNKKNVGYSKSYNIGTKFAKGRYILHLNSDIEFLKGSFNQLLKYLDLNKNIGIVGCKILKSNGQLDKPCKRSFPTLSNIFFQTIGLSKLLPSNKIFGKYYLSFIPDSQICEIDCVMGAFMLIRREVFKKIGFLDERFFFYGEDIDFCFRAKQAGFKVLYYPKIIIQHVHGGTTRQNSLKYIWMFHRAMFLYYKKHYSKSSNFLINWVAYSAIFTRFFVLLIGSIFLKILGY